LLTFALCLSAVANALSNDGGQFTERLHQDWIRQDAAPFVTDWRNTPNGGAFTDAMSNTLETRMVQRVLAELEGNTEHWMTQLRHLQAAGVPGNDPRWHELYIAAAYERRAQRLRFVHQFHPVLVYAQHATMGGSFYAYTEMVTDAQHRDRIIPPGGALRKLEITPEGQIIDTELLSTTQGLIRDPDVSFDGTTIVFSMRHCMDTDDYKLYDMCAATGTIRQLTFGLGFADVEPAFLPDGNIMFGSTRGMQIVDCWWTEVVNKWIIDPDGRFMRRVGFDQVHTNFPTVLPDGRVVYTRWDYNDRGQTFTHGLFVMNHDGTGQAEFYANNSWWPMSILHARGIPNSNLVVAIASGHHTLQTGKLILIDRSAGTQEDEGVKVIAPIRDAAVIRENELRQLARQYRAAIPLNPELPTLSNACWGQAGDQFQYPIGLNEEHFIVGFRPDPQRFGHQNFGLFYIDINNSKRELLAWNPTPNMHAGRAVPLQEREVPMLRASQVDFTQTTGTYFVQDVHFGPGLEGVERGTITCLQVVALQYRHAGMGLNYNRGASGSADVSTPISIDNASWDVKQVLGTVPVEADGSAFFEVPARLPLYFMLLNERGEKVQTMRSWSTLMPGEQQSCFGCHADKGSTMNIPGIGGGMVRPLALQRAASIPVPVKGVDPDRGFSFVRSIQPILDQNCISCHIGGEGNPFSLLDRTSYLEIRQMAIARRSFSDSYLNLTRRGQQNEFVNWLDVQSVPTLLPPNYAGAIRSQLVSMFDDGNRSEAHRDVRITDAERRLFALWIDLLVPFVGCYMERHLWTLEEQAEYAYFVMKRYAMKEIEQENIRLLIAWERGEIDLPPLEAFPQFDRGGLEARRAFIEAWVREARAGMISQL
jgi:hypothetical protein